MNETQRLRILSGKFYGWLADACDCCPGCAANLARWVDWFGADLLGSSEEEFSRVRDDIARVKAIHAENDVSFLDFASELQAAFKGREIQEMSQ